MSEEYGIAGWFFADFNEVVWETHPNIPILRLLSSQATSQVNDCGNDILPETVGCQNTDRQLQDGDNSCTSNSLIANQVFPDEIYDWTILQPFQSSGATLKPSDSSFNLSLV